jgi:hypothetical protein
MARQIKYEDQTESVWEWRHQERLFREPQEAVVEVAITKLKRGRVSFSGTEFPGQLYECGDITLLPNQTILVVGCIGLVLLCKPLE